MQTSIVYQRAEQIPVSEMVLSRRLQLFGHVARGDVEQDHARALKAMIRGSSEKLEEARRTSSPDVAESGHV